MDHQKKINDTDVLLLGRNISKFDNLLNDVVDVIWKSEKYINQPDRFMYTILMKIKYILEPLHFQIYNLDQKPHYAVCTALALRTCMLDVLTLYYVLDVYEDGGQVITRINTLMADHLKYVYHDLKEPAKADIRKDWPELFEADGGLKKFKSLNASDLYKGITKLDSFKREAEDARHIYSVFSKYEHNGALTYDLMHNPYSPVTSKTIKFMIKCAVNSCVIALRALCSVWIPKESKLSADLDLAVREFLAV